MSGDELAERARRHLRFGAERVGLLRAVAVPAPDRPPRELGPDAVPPVRVEQRYVEAADEVRRGVYRIFGRRYDLGFPPAWNVDPSTGTAAPLRFGKTLDYRDPSLVGDAKRLWEINRHLEAVTLAQAYRLTGDLQYLRAMRLLISSWMDQCPYPKGVNWCSALELGIRLINWQLAYTIAGGPSSALFDGEEGERFRERWLRSIYRHGHFVMHHLSTFSSSANNHLIGELAGVYAAFCAWPCWPAARKWRAQARERLEHEIVRQTHPDGVNKEQTTWYQQFVASLLVAAAVAGLRSGARFGPVYWSTLERMLELVAAVMDVGGNVPLIGDADDGLAFALEPRAQLDPFRALLGIGAALFDRPEWRARATGAEDSAHWLCAGLAPVVAQGGVEAVPAAHAGARRVAGAFRTSTRSGPAEPTDTQPGAGRRDFPSGGYFVLGRNLGQSREIRSVVDAGPLGFLSIAAHGHADCLSMTLSVAGREQLVDTGTYAYHSGGVWRDYFRGTAAHNTLRIDGVDQSRIGGPFLWLEKAEARVERVEHEPDHDLVTAAHDGYMRLPDPVRHEREIRFDKHADRFEIVDRLACAGEHVVERFWHFAETCRVGLRDGRAVSFDGAVRLAIETADGAEGRLLRGSVDPIAGWRSRSFQHKMPITTLVFTSRIEGAVVLRTLISVEGAR